MGKQPVKMRAVVYALSPFQQKIMSGLWKDLPSKITHKVSENWISATLLLAPLVGTYSYVQNFKEKEKLEHREEVRNREEAKGDEDVQIMEGVEVDQEMAEATV